MQGKISGNASVHTIGNVSIAPGTHAAAITDTAFRKIASVPILAVDTGFASTKSQSLWSKVRRVSSSGAFGLAWSIRAQKPGRRSGTGPTMSMSTTSMTDTTCTIGGIPELPLPSTSPCSPEATLRNGVSLSRFASGNEGCTGTAGVTGAPPLRLPTQDRVRILA